MKLTPAQVKVLEKLAGIPDSFLNETWLPGLRGSIHATCAALYRKGLLDSGRFDAWRITPAGLEALRELEAGK